MATTTNAPAHEDGHGHDATHDHHDDGRVHAHVSSFPFLVGIFATLIFLTFVTVAVSYFDFGWANTLVALVVASIKAGLVSAFFMHLRHEKGFNSVIFLLSFVFLALFLLFTLDDLGTRGKVDPNNGVTVLERTGELAPGGMPSAGAMGIHSDGRILGGYEPAAAGHGAAGGHGAPAAGHGAAAPSGAPAHH